VKGDTGATGAEGPQGPKGDTGATGPQGPAGNSAIGVAYNAVVATAETMNASASNQATYNNLATNGPAMVFTTTSAGAKAMVFVTAEIKTSSSALVGRMSFEIIGPDGSVTIVPADSRSLCESLQSGSTNTERATAVTLVTLGAPGNYTITAKYRVQQPNVQGNEFVTFSNREVVVTLF
jgi:hypothetical protein